MAIPYNQNIKLLGRAKAFVNQVKREMIKHDRSDIIFPNNKQLKFRRDRKTFHIIVTDFSGVAHNYPDLDTAIMSEFDFRMTAKDKLLKDLIGLAKQCEKAGLFPTDMLSITNRINAMTRENPSRE
jgi:hypothetical protein